MESHAFFLRSNGKASQAFHYQPFQISDPIGNEILIEVEAFGLNFADVMARLGLYQEAPPLPCIVGYEIIGIVKKCGPTAKQSLVGKRVAAFCRFGGYAKHVLTGDYAAVPVGDQNAVELLGLITQGVTAYYMACILSPIQPDDLVLIHSAAGGVGSILIQLAKSKGAEVIAKVGSEEKGVLARALGADHVVNYNKSDYLKQIKLILNGGQIDISYNAVAGLTYKKDMSILATGGRMVLFGGSDLSTGQWGVFSKLNFIRRMGFIIPIKLMLQGKNILGVNMLKIADNKPKVLELCLKEIIKLYLTGIIKPQIGGEYSAAQLAEAHRALEKGQTTGKLGVYW